MCGTDVTDELRGQSARGAIAEITAAGGLEMDTWDRLVLLITSTYPEGVEALRIAAAMHASEPAVRQVCGRLARAGRLTAILGGRYVLADNAPYAVAQQTAGRAS